MLRIRSYLTVLMATCLLLVGGPILGTAPEGRAENVQLNQDIPMQMQILVTPLAHPESGIAVVGRRLDEIIGCAWHSLIGCRHVPDAKSWAERGTDWQYPGGNKTDGTKANAFKHCIWMGATATRLGELNSRRVGDVHEWVATNQPEDLKDMDKANNLVGVRIGVKAKEDNLSDQWGYVIEECKKQAESNQLHGLNGIKGNYSDKDNKQN